MNAALLSYTVNRINEAKLVMTPYPHVYITDIFEPNFYRDCILVRCPRPRLSPAPESDDGVWHGQTQMWHTHVGTYLDTVS